MPRRVTAPRMARKALLEAFEVDEGAEERRDVALALAHNRLDEGAKGGELVDTLDAAVGRRPTRRARRRRRRLRRRRRVPALNRLERLLADESCRRDGSVLTDCDEKERKRRRTNHLVRQRGSHETKDAFIVEVLGDEGAGVAAGHVCVGVREEREASAKKRDVKSDLWGGEGR